ncbi:MAG: o-succinylbenzoate synthase [Planctomycetota bacterium]
MNQRLRLHPLRLALRAPLVTAAGTISERQVWLVEATDGKLSGWGEAAPLPGFGGETPDICAKMLAAAVAGSSAPNPTETPCATAAISDALADLAARQQARPFAYLQTKHIRVNALAANEADVLAACDAGATVVKLKAGRDATVAAMRVESLLAQRPGLRLRLDANASWDEASATVFARRAGALVDYVEQPLPVGDLAGCARLRKLGLRIALDEGIRNRADLDAAIAAHACDVVILKPNWLGGMQATGLLAVHAKAAGLRVVISSALGSAVERLVAANVAAQWAFDEAHGLDTGRLLVRDVAILTQTTPYTITLPDGPGLGMTPVPW